jgi:hypothetical protein
MPFWKSKITNDKISKAYRLILGSLFIRGQNSFTDVRKFIDLLLDLLFWKFCRRLCDDSVKTCRVGSRLSYLKLPFLDDFFEIVVHLLVGIVSRLLGGYPSLAL